jgi:hypothetical protein
MTIEENRAFMKDFFERYYEKRKNIDIICVEGVGIPPEMLEEGADPNKEWNVWKLYPSVVTENDIAKCEEKIGVKLPKCLEAFFSVYHHRFDTAIGRNYIKSPFHDLEISYNHHLVSNGYLPFGWDSDSFFIRCIDLANMPNEEKCSVVEIDHEPFFNLMYDFEPKGMLIPKKELLKLFRPVASNFYEYLDGVYNDIIK